MMRRRKLILTAHKNRLRAFLWCSSGCESALQGGDTVPFLAGELRPHVLQSNQAPVTQLRHNAAKEINTYFLKKQVPSLGGTWQEDPQPAQPPGTVL